MKKILMLFVLSLLMGLAGFSNAANAGASLTTSKNTAVYFDQNKPLVF